MISTVTTSTVTTISAVTGMGLTTVIAVIVIVALMVLLTSRELATTINSTSSQHVARFSSIGILPLLMIFAVTVSMKIAAILA